MGRFKLLTYYSVETLYTAYLIIGYTLAIGKTHVTRIQCSNNCISDFKIKTGRGPVFQIRSKSWIFLEKFPYSLNCCSTTDLFDTVPAFQFHLKASQRVPQCSGDTRCLSVSTLIAAIINFSCKLSPCCPVWRQHAQAGIDPCLTGRWRDSCLDFSSQNCWLILMCSDIFPRACVLSQDGLSRLAKNQPAGAGSGKTGRLESQP